MARRPNRRRNRPGKMYQDINNPNMGIPQRILPYNPGGRPNYGFNDPVMPDNTTMMPGGKPNVGGVGGFSPEDVVTADFSGQIASPAAPQGVDLYGNPLGPVQPQMNQGPLRNLRPQGPDNMPGMPRTYGPDNMPGMQQQMPYQQMPYQQSPYQMYGGFGFPQMGFGQQSFNPMFGGIASMPMQFGGGMTGAQYGQSMMGGRGKGGGGSPQQQSPFGQPMMGGRGKGGGGYSPYM